MNITIVLLTIIFLNSVGAAKIVCYYSSWAIYYKSGGDVKPEDLDPNLCTHINYAFVLINDDGSFKIEDQEADITRGGYKHLTDLKLRNTNLKVLLSVGGASASPKTFASVAANSTKRANLVRSARSFMIQYKFDGVDVDWEVPGKADKANFVSLLEDLKNDFKKNGWLVTAAVASDIGEGYDVKQISSILDWINLMTYDFYGPWSDYTGQNSALYASSVESQWEKQNLNLAAAVNNWLAAGATAGKIVAGLAFYGHTFTLKNPSVNGIHAPINGAGNGGPIMEEKGSISNAEFCMQKSSWNCRWDNEQKMPICLNGNQWLGIENTQSMQEKINFIKSKNLAGGMIWSIDQDDVKGTKCGAGPNPLLRLIHDNL